jgi:hypothetical protein
MGILAAAGKFVGSLAGKTMHFYLSVWLAGQLLLLAMIVCLLVAILLEYT